MVKMQGFYKGQKNCEITHGPSGATLHTDAPRDNHGRGESFSPTDLLCTSLGACIMTIMAIEAEKENLDLVGSTFEVIKIMSSTPPRRVEKIMVLFQMKSGLTKEWQEKLVHAAQTCPVKLSLNPNILIEINFQWG